MQFLHGCTLRNLSAIPVYLWLLNMFLFRTLMIKPVSDGQGYAQAVEIQNACRVRLEQSTLFQRSYQLNAMQQQAAGELTLAAWRRSSPAQARQHLPCR